MRGILSNRKFSFLDGRVEPFIRDSVDEMGPVKDIPAVVLAVAAAVVVEPFVRLIRR